MYKISNSVGKRGVNKCSDVGIVQVLLNRHIVPPARVLKVDEIAGPKTITAILAFQHRLGLLKCDGLVNPASRTFSALCSLPHSVPITELYLQAFRNYASMLGNLMTDVGSDIKGHIKSAWISENSPSIHPPISLPMRHLPPSPPDAIAWGAKVTPEFKKRVIEICDELGIVPDYLMACMAFESCETFRADILNKAGSKAVGLIQFIPTTAKSLGTTTEDLANMNPVKQLEYVRKFFIWKKGKLKTLEDLYMAIIYPIAIGKDPDTAIFVKGDGTLKYAQNKSLDKNKDNEITPRECTAAARAAYDKGLSKGYFG